MRSTSDTAIVVACLLRTGMFGYPSRHPR